MEREDRVLGGFLGEAGPASGWECGEHGRCVNESEWFVNEGLGEGKGEDSRRQCSPHLTDCKNREERLKIGKLEEGGKGPAVSASEGLRTLGPEFSDCRTSVPSVSQRADRLTGSAGSRFSDLRAKRMSIYYIMAFRLINVTWFLYLHTISTFGFSISPQTSIWFYYTLRT